MTGDLRDRIFEALTTTPSRLLKNPAHHGPADVIKCGEGHNYLMTCALCRGEAHTLADAVLSVVEAEQVEYEETVVGGLNQRVIRAERRAGRAEAAIARVRALAEQWAALAPADAAVTADAGRAVLAALDARRPDDAEQSRTTPDGEAAAKACEGFHWIGQPFYCCDNCGRPAWEHAGMHTFDRSKGLFGDTVGHVEPWKPGEADAIRARWEPVWRRNGKDGEQR